MKGESQSGIAALGVIAMLGLIFALVQTTIFFTSRSSSRLMSSEKNKVLAQQAAEAGVEENIADLGSRKVRPVEGMNDHATYMGRAVGNGTFTTLLTTLGLGPEADTVELSSTGRVAGRTQRILARLKIKRYLDSALTPLMIVDPDTIITNVTVLVSDTASDTTVQNPAAMPPINTTPAYAACMASAGTKCNICHIPAGLVEMRQVMNLLKAQIAFHTPHPGDYVTTDGTCDIYNPKVVETITETAMVVPETTLVDNTVYDTVVVVDTLAKVQILSWK